jgi:hypothetical protein
MYMSERELVAELERVRQEAEFERTEARQLHQIRLSLMQDVKDLRVENDRLRAELAEYRERAT